MGRFLDSTDAPDRLDTDLWPRILSLLEVVEETLVLLEAPGPDSDDFINLAAFVSTAILHDVTQNLWGLEQLLPFMGPLTVANARGEVSVHAEFRHFDESAVDWTSASTRFVRSDVDPRSFLPIDG